MSCKICSGVAKDIGAVYFNKNCAGHDFGSNSERLAYYQCRECGFLFTRHMDLWSHKVLMERIYNNADYVLVDPEITGARAKRNAELIIRLIPHTTSYLDWGGGHGHLIEILREKGFINADWCDLMFGKLIPFNQTFDFISCFEVLEHSPNPPSTVQTIIHHLAPDGIVLFSTHTLPPDFDLSWWYVAPRNGHISIFTKEALRILWDQVGFNVIHLTPDRHVAQRRK